MNTSDCNSPGSFLKSDPMTEGVAMSRNCSCWLACHLAGWGRSSQIQVDGVLGVGGCEREGKGWDRICGEVVHCWVAGSAEVPSSGTSQLAGFDSWKLGRCPVGQQVSRLLLGAGMLAFGRISHNFFLGFSLNMVVWGVWVATESV